MSVLLLVCGTTYVRDVRFATCDAYESAAESQAITNSDNGTRASKPAVAKVINHVQITWIRDGRQQHQPQWRARHAERARFPKSERDPQRRLGRRADHRAGRIAIPSRRRCADSGNRHRDLQNTIAARHDPIFDELANTPARGGLWHLRLASSNLPLILENQQPFYANGLSFIHNGDISDDQGRNIITNRAFPVDPSIVQSTGGRSDSAIFFAVILQYIGFGFALDEAVAQAVRELRKSYPKSSYNCMIQSQDQFIALCAAGREVTSKRIVEIYDQYGRGEQARDYRVLRYRALGGNDDAQPKGVVVASSGFDQRAEDGWTRLENDQMIVASNRTGEFRVRSI